MKVGDVVEIDGDTYEIIGIFEDHFKEYRLFREGSYYRLAIQNGYHLQKEELYHPDDETMEDLQYVKRIDPRTIEHM